MKAYNYDDFRKACKNGNVQILKAALLRAYEDFKIKEESDLLLVINEDLIENLHYYRTEDHTGIPDTHIDSYLFRYHGIAGYMAFFISGMTKVWVIKSFHRSREANSYFAEQLKKALLTKTEKDKKDE